MSAPTQNNNHGRIPRSNVEPIDPDSVQEVRVETSNSSAQYATPGLLSYRLSAGRISKCGTNKLHGSFFKVFPIRKGMFLRVNLDAFNVFNVPGENNPGPDGIEGYLNSYQAARQLQITALHLLAR